MLQIKVCGMRDTSNIAEMVKLNIQYLGFIFYPQSPRFVNDLSSETLESIPSSINKVGVFVNENLDTVIEKADKYQLSFIQLHGKESIEYCQKLKKLRSKLKLIKAFNIASKDDFIGIEAYEELCSYFLFDTKTTIAGGSGKKFDWTILDHYQRELPFFLSGGISSEDVGNIHKIVHSKLFALDLNSRFEVAPALKSIDLLNQFIKKLQSTSKE